MKKIAVIFAGGVGSRMGASIPKQFLNVYGKPILIHTIEKFQYNENIDAIYVGCKKEYIPLLEVLIEKYNLTKIPTYGVIPGGTTGQDTIYLLLKQVEKYEPSDSIVLIHDGVRPLINDQLINDNIECVTKNGTSITCANCIETPVISEDGNEIDTVLKRNSVLIAKAPQCFILKNILEAHEIIRKKYPNYNNERIVDSCSLYMETGNKVAITKGSNENIKVTTRDDYIKLLSNLTIEDQEQIFMLDKKLRR